MMETMERERRPRRSFSKEFKQDAVALVRSSDKTIAELARDLDLTESALHPLAAHLEPAAVGRSRGPLAAHHHQPQRLGHGLTQDLQVPDPPVPVSGGQVHHAHPTAAQPHSFAVHASWTSPKGSPAASRPRSLAVPTSSRRSSAMARSFRHR